MSCVNVCVNIHTDVNVNVNVEDMLVFYAMLCYIMSFCAMSSTAGPKP